MTNHIKGKSIAMIIAFKDFRDQEYFAPKEIFENAGIKVKTIGAEKGTAMGADGGTTEVDLLMNEAEPADFDAVVFVGGPGALEYLNNEDSYKLAKETVSQNKILAAICVSPVILAKAGVLKGKRATVWSSASDKSTVKILNENGAIFEDRAVVVDENIITANGPAASQEFANKIMQTL